jgi:hypothetical protein
MMQYKKLLSVLLGAATMGYLFSCAGTGGKDDATRSVNDVMLERLVKKGEYLVTVIGCGDCHSPKIMTPAGPRVDSSRWLSGYPADRPLPEYPEALIGKGYVVVNGDLTAAMGPWGTSFAANLTSDETGIGNWKEDQFKNALTHGKYKGLDAARPLMPPMPWQNWTNMKDADVRAIFYYLKSTRPVKNVVPAFQPAVKN